MLRTDLFKTVDRAETRFIAVRDTITPADPSIDAIYMDAKHCRQGRLGLGVHFLVLVNGIIQLGRDINTIGSHSRNFDKVSVAIGVVGGKDEKSDKRLNTRTPEQLSALEDLIEVLSERYPSAEVHDNPNPHCSPS